MKNIEKFVDLPKLYLNRSAFNFHPTSLTTMNVGDLVPLYTPIEVIPGDTFKVRTNHYIEVSTFVEPIMDSLYFDIFYFYCPFRILWENYIYFFGENKQDPYDSIGVYSMPQVSFPEGGFEVGTIADYMALPVYRGGVDNTVNALYFRGYAKIVNEFFIADYLDSKANENYNIDATITGSNGGDYVTDLVKGGKPFVVNKLYDKFTACLPKPQAGDPVLLPLGSLDVNDLPVIPKEGVSNLVGKDVVNTNVVVNNGGVYALNNRNVSLGSRSTGSLDSVYTSQESFQVGGTGFDNLVATGASAFSSNATINDLRNAIAVQQLLEAESRHGNRYFEQLVGDYGVINSDLRLMRPEYLGGARFMLKVNKVVQQSQSTDTSAQGTLTAYSVTTFTHTDFTKSFMEPGLFFPLGCVRYLHSYSQGIPKGFLKKDKYDYYNHHFDGIGEQPVLSKEIYFDGTEGDDDVFGYMPYATEYRTLDNIITGEMRPDYSLSLDSYHFGDNYTERPALSSEWLKEDKSNVDRTLVVQSSNSMQLKCQFGFSITGYRPISANGIPGLRRL